MIHVRYYAYMKKTYFIPVIAVAIAITLLIIYLPSSESPTSGTSTSTPALSSDQIFAEASAQLGFTRDQVSYFDIFGQDKAQYNLGEGVTFAYKADGIWRISGPSSSQEVPVCATLATVPLQYRQACYDETSGQSLYVDPANGQNLHYPISQRVKYI